MKHYSFEKSLKTGTEASFFNANTILTYPAPLIVKLLFPTRITSHQVIFASLIAGLATGYFMGQPGYFGAIFGVILLLIKNVLDKVDGQLARARGTGSRYGRFLDSISDFIVNLAVYAGLTMHLYRNDPEMSVLLLGAASLIFSLIQCSFFVYYQVSYVNFVNPLGLNRTNEAITDEDRRQSRISAEGKKTLTLQQVYLMIYGWQDTFIRIIDFLMYNRIQKRYPGAEIDSVWYLDKRFLSLSSFLGLGTQIGIISLFVLLNRIDIYFWYTCIAANVYMAALFVYRYVAAWRKMLLIDSKKG